MTCPISGAHQSRAMLPPSASVRIAPPRGPTPHQRRRRPPEAGPAASPLHRDAAAPYRHSALDTRSKGKPQMPDREPPTARQDAIRGSAHATAANHFNRSAQKPPMPTIVPIEDAAAICTTGTRCQFDLCHLPKKLTLRKPCGARPPTNRPDLDTLGPSAGQLGPPCSLAKAADRSRFALTPWVASPRNAIAAGIA